MEGKYATGDRIEVIATHDHAKKGMIGTVLSVRNDELSIKFDEKFSGGHQCNGLCPDGYGHYVPKKKVVSYQDKEY